jgi:hypothetical protein
VPKRAAERSKRLGGGIVKAAALLGAGLVLGVSIYAGLVKADVLPNSFGPTARGDLELARSDRPGVRVLFVGNSLTHENSMPALVGELAADDEGATAIFAVEYTAGGWMLRDAAEDEGLAELLDDVRWDVVVLQEQSQMPSFSRAQRAVEMDPYARALDRRIRLSGARTMLFLTWAHRDGDPRNMPGDSFGAMQSRLFDGYAEIAAELSATIAPVGLAWAEAWRRRPGLELWADDGRHPSRAGSYLAACVFYAALTGRDPRMSGFTDGLEPADARFLQQVAADVLER